MHKAIIGMFNLFRNIFYFLRMLTVFLILVHLLYWIYNLTHASWMWMDFFKPFLDCLLSFTDKIYSASFNFWGAVFEFKYFTALLILTAVSYLFKYLYFLVDILEGLYRSTRKICKKSEENLLNKQLHENMKREEKKITKYAVMIKTRIKKKFSHQELSINLKEQTDIMNKFIREKTAVVPTAFNGVYLYQYDNFDKVDNVLDVYFKLLKSSAPIDYAICIQVGSDIHQLGKLMELEEYEKVIMAADTAYRYRFNETHRYKTAQVGLFQNGEKTLEVHEFQPIM